MAVRENSAIICSVAFVEIVDYARKPVEAQMRAHERFNALLARALSSVPTAERIVLNTAEGVAISFLGNAEACLYFVLTLRDALVIEGDAIPKLRIGINSGPVRLVKDHNGQLNLIGDGMNVGQRIVGFAGADQTFVSATFHAAVSRLDPDCTRLFDFVGTRTDAQVREHALYSLNHSLVSTRPPHPRTPTSANSSGVRAAFVAMSAPLLRHPPFATVFAVTLILLTAVALRQMVHHPGGVLPAPAVAEAPAQGEFVLAPTEGSMEPVRATPPAPAEARPKVAPKPEPRASSLPPATNVREASGAIGTVRLMVVPWGEVYVDGDKAGVAPPLREVALKPGLHHIEIRNPGIASYTQAVDVRPGEEIRIRHRFD